MNKFALALRNAQVAELVDALDSKSSDLGREGSIPFLGTMKNPSIVKLTDFSFYTLFALLKIDRNP